MGVRRMMATAVLAACLGGFVGGCGSDPADGRGTAPAAAAAPLSASAVVARIDAGPNQGFDVEYLAAIDQAARTRDAAALDRLVGCQASGGCAAYDALWATTGVMDQIPVLLEQGVIGRDEGSFVVPRFVAAGMYGRDKDAAEKNLLGVAFPSEYRGLVLVFHTVRDDGTRAVRQSLAWESAYLQRVPASTARLVGLSVVTAANMPPADPAVLARVRTTMDSGRPLVAPANLVALVLEAAQDHDIDALLKLCQPCSQDTAYRRRFIAEMTDSEAPGSDGRFDELAAALLTHPAAANGPSGMYYPGYAQTWLAPWSAANPDGPRPGVDAADRAAHGVRHEPGFRDLGTVFAVLDDGQVPDRAWMGLTGLR